MKLSNDFVTRIFSLRDAELTVQQQNGEAREKLYYDYMRGLYTEEAFRSHEDEIKMWDSISCDLISELELILTCAVENDFDREEVRYFIDSRICNYRHKKNLANEAGDESMWRGARYVWEQLKSLYTIIFEMNS